MPTVDLGRRELHDPASRAHQTPHRKAARGHSVRHRLGAKHLDQFYLSGCVGFSGGTLLNTAPAAASRRLFNRSQHQRFTAGYLGNPDGIAGYSASTKRDPFAGEYPPTDEGSSALGLMKWWRELGIIDGYKWVIDGGLDALLATLQTQPLLIGSWWFDDMMTTDRRGLVTSACNLDDPGAGGHEYLANAVLWERKLIGFEQTWGEHPEGFSPTFYMRWELVEHLVFGLDGDVAVPGLL